MKIVNIRTVKINELKQCSLELLVSICKSLDNGNGDWSDVHESEYDDILQSATELVTDYQSNL
jgi:hypothetical protein